MVGNVAKLKGETLVHAHIGLSRKDLSQIGGHVSVGCIANVVEIYFKLFDIEIEREKDFTTGLNLIKF